MSAEKPVNVSADLWPRDYTHGTVLYYFHFTQNKHAALLTPGLCSVTLVFLKPPPSVRSRVLRDVSLPGGGGEVRVLTRAASALPSPAPLLGEEKPGTLAASPESLMSRYLLCFLSVFLMRVRSAVSHAGLLINDGFYFENRAVKIRYLLAERPQLLPHWSLGVPQN